MIPIKELIPLLENAKEVRITWAGTAREFDIADQIESEAYGDFMCDAIASFGTGMFELQIALHPIKTEEV